MSSQISDKLHRFCVDRKSVTSEYAEDSSKPPGHYAEKLFTHELPSIAEKKPPHERTKPSKSDLERARQCGDWGGTEPSDLFLACFHDALCSLDHDPLNGVISPSKMGSYGVVPLTVMSTVPDICRHMSNLIARAEHEVFLATNFWITSDSSRLITDALLELSRRAEKRGKRVVVKIMYDRGNVKQVIDNHQIVPEDQYTGGAVKIPSHKDVPFIDLEVQNYHRPAFGTFHSKFMIVDRKIGIVQSNNIQDNDNMEMMVHFEGPVVDSLYDTALLAWYAPMKPPLPLLAGAPAQTCTETFNDPSFEALFKKSQESGQQQFASQVVQDAYSVKLPQHVGGDPHFDSDIASELLRQQHVMAPSGNETVVEAVTRHLNQPTRQSHKGTAPACDPADNMIPMRPHAPHQPFPIALVNRKPWGAPNHQCVNVPQNEAWLSGIRNATSSVFIQTPNLNAAPLIPALRQALERGIEVIYYVCLGYNDAGELLPFQGGINEMVANKLYQSLDPAARNRLHVHYYVAKDQVKPVHNKFKARSCHIKLMIVDGHVGIQGNGNQDTQSWFHSMEVNIMIDSAQVCEEWMDTIRRNQNTHIYGEASKEDGIWRDADGNEPEGAIGKDPGRFSWAKGVIGAVQRVRGAGGF